MKKIKIYTQSLIIKSITGYINSILITFDKVTKALPIILWRMEANNKMTWQNIRSENGLKKSRNMAMAAVEKHWSVVTWWAPSVERVYACTRHNKHVGDASSTIIFWPLLKMREILPTVAERDRTLVSRYVTGVPNKQEKKKKSYVTMRVRKKCQMFSKTCWFPHRYISMFLCASLKISC